MIDAVAQILVPGVGSAISVMPVLAVVVMLTSTGGRGKAVGFCIAWFVALTAIAFVVAWAGSAVAVDDDTAQPSTTAGVVHLALGALLVWFAWSQWRSRPRSGEAPPTPAWLDTIDQMSTLKASAVGGVLGGANVKNLPLAIGVGILIAESDLSVGGELVVAVVYGALASLGVVAPLLVALLAGDRADAMIGSMRSWLIANNNVIMAVLMLLLGVSFLSDGLLVLG